jgi:TolA-binding protein
MSDEHPAPEGAARDELAPIVEFVQKHGSTLLTVLAVVLAVIAGVILYRNHAENKRREAMEAVFTAPRVDDLEAILSRHGGSPAAPLALLKLAKAYFRAGNYDAALSRYAEFQTRYPDHEFADIAELGRIRCLAEQSQPETALAAFTTFIEKNPDHYLAAPAVMGKAECLERLQRNQEARTVYEDFVQANTNSAWGALAEERLERINTRLERGLLPAPSTTVTATEPAQPEVPEPDSPEPE